MYEKDGQSYFVVDSHMHYWDASPANWVKGHEEYAKGWIECFHAYQSLGPPETHWSIEKFQKYSEEDTMADLFDRGHVDVAIFAADVPQGVVHRRLQHHRAQRRTGREASRQVRGEHPLRPA